MTCIGKAETDRTQTMDSEESAQNGHSGDLKEVNTNEDEKEETSQIIHLITKEQWKRKDLSRNSCNQMEKLQAKFLPCTQKPQVEIKEVNG